jgi:hypothetical protein
MKITKTYLRQVIKEELAAVMEGHPIEDPNVAMLKFARSPDPALVPEKSTLPHGGPRGYGKEVLEYLATKNLSTEGAWEELVKNEGARKEVKDALAIIERSYSTQRPWQYIGPILKAWKDFAKKERADQIELMINDKISALGGRDTEEAAFDDHDTEEAAFDDHDTEEEDRNTAIKELEEDGLITSAEMKQLMKQLDLA